VAHTRRRPPDQQEAEEERRGSLALPPVPWDDFDESVRAPEAVAAVGAAFAAKLAFYARTCSGGNANSGGGGAQGGNSHRCACRIAADAPRVRSWTVIVAAGLQGSFFNSPSVNFGRRFRRTWKRLSFETRAFLRLVYRLLLTKIWPRCVLSSLGNARPKMRYKYVPPTARLTAAWGTPSPLGRWRQLK
jgi:hypothetical protein